MDEKTPDPEMLKELDILLDLDVLEEDETVWDPLSDLSEVDEQENGK